MAIDVIKQMMLDEIKREQKLLKVMTRRKAGAPKGSLHVKKRNGSVYVEQKLYVEGRHMTICLDPDKEEHLEIINKLVDKKAIVHGLPILRKNITALKKCASTIERYHPSDYKYGNRVSKELYLDDDVCLKDWLSKPECVNPYKPTWRVQDTKRGPKVRSKSEAKISDMLFDLGVWHKYETLLYLGKRKVYPDFELIHPVTNRVIWWEHLGMIDDLDYLRVSLKKIIEYSKHGIFVGDNLILTWETKEDPLTRSKIKQRFREFGII